MNEVRFGIPMFVLHENGLLPGIRVFFGVCQSRAFLSMVVMT